MTLGHALHRCIPPDPHLLICWYFGFASDPNQNQMMLVSWYMMTTIWKQMGGKMSMSRSCKIILEWRRISFGGQSGYSSYSPRGMSRLGSEGGSLAASQCWGRSV